MSYLALFDIDMTIIEGDSYCSWCDFLIEQNYLDAQDYANASKRYGEYYHQGNMNIYDYVAFCTALVQGLNIDTLRALRAEFFRARLLPMLRPKAAQCIQMHQQRGAKVILISATHSFIVEPLAQHLQVELIGTDVRLNGDHFSTEVDGTACFQAGKITKLQTWLDSNKRYKLAGAWFYSDSHNDLPLLHLVDNPVVVNPDPTLAQAAERHDWPEAAFAMGS